MSNENGITEAEWNNNDDDDRRNRRGGGNNNSAASRQQQQQQQPDDDDRPRRRRIVRAIRPAADVSTATAAVASMRVANQLNINRVIEGQDDEDDDDEEEGTEEAEEEEDEDADDIADARGGEERGHEIDVMFNSFLDFIAASSAAERCGCADCRAKRLLFGGGNFSDSDDVESSEEEESERMRANRPTCAICLEPQSKKRTLAVLPCCGQDNKEETSSTRFCVSCVRKCLERNGVSTSRGCCIGECPRCKHLLAISNKNNKKKVKKNKPPISIIKKATIKHMIFYVARQNRGGYRMYLVSMAWCYGQYLPAEVLMQDERTPEDKLRHLCQWGLLHKHSSNGGAAGENNSDLYWMDSDAQKELQYWCSQYLTADLDGDLRTIGAVENVKGNIKKQCFMSALNCAVSGYRVLRKHPMHNIVRCIRIWNRGLTLLIVAGGILPDPQQWTNRYSGWLASSLNIFFLLVMYKVLVKAFWILLYLGTGWATAKMVGSWMRDVAPSSKPWLRWLRNITMYSAGGLFFLYCGYVGMLLFLVWGGNGVETKAQ